MAWMDNTGLYRKFGTEKAVVNLVGEYCTYGSLREVMIRLPLATLPAGPATTTILGDVTLLPKMRIEEVETVILTPGVGGSAFSLGTVRDDRVTSPDTTALLSALATTVLDDPAGTKVVYRVGVGGAGTAIGTTLANPSHIIAALAGAVFTAGLVEIRIRYMAI